MMSFRQKNYDSYSDEQLIPKIIAGDHRAFTEIYKRYSPRLLYYFYRMLGSSNDKAQDFLQDIFIKLIDKAHLFDRSKKFCTWFFSIAYNMCKNEYRRLGTRNVCPMEDFMESFSEESSDELQFDENRTDLTDFSKSLFDELENFDEIHKSVFLLHYREGFSLKEISQTLDISEGTVKSRLFYTRKRLSEKLISFRPNLEII